MEEKIEELQKELTYCTDLTKTLIREIREAKERLEETRQSNKLIVMPCLSLGFSTAALLVTILPTVI